MTNDQSVAIYFLITLQRLGLEGPELDGLMFKYRK